MKILGFILAILFSGKNDELRKEFLLILIQVLVSKVQSGGDIHDPYAPQCKFGPFGIVMNTFGDCNKPCAPTQSAVQTNYEGSDICCCN